MGAKEVSAFLAWLAVERRVSASTQNQALSGLLFLYRQVLGLDLGPIEHTPRARMPDKLPVVLSREEVGLLMKHVEGVMWLIVALLYGIPNGDRRPVFMCTSRWSRKRSVKRFVVRV